MPGELSLPHVLFGGAQVCHSHLTVGELRLLPSVFSVPAVVLLLAPTAFVNERKERASTANGALLELYRYALARHGRIRRVVFHAFPLPNSLLATRPFSAQAVRSSVTLQGDILRGACSVMDSSRVRVRRQAACSYGPR